MRWWEQDDGTVEDCGFHGPAHHGVGQESGDACVAVFGFGVAEMALEGLPVHGVVCFEEAEVGEEPVLLAEYLQRRNGVENSLLKTVQQWCTCKAPSEHTLQILACQRSPSSVILDSMSFIKNNTIPVDFM